MNLSEERQQWEAHARSIPLPDDINVTEKILAGVSCLLVSSQASTSDKVIVYIHGGGLVSGSALTHKPLAASLAAASGATVLLVDYRLLPEHPFPAPLDDVLKVYLALISTQYCTAKQLILGGDSSGVALALSLIIRVRDTGVEVPAGLFMLCGALDATLSGESMVFNDGRDPMLSHRELVDWRDTFLPDPGCHDLSPLFADLGNLPDTLLLAAGKDLWLSDSVRAEERITSAGGRVKLRVWESMGHMWMMDPAPAESAEAMTEIGDFVSAGLTGGNSA